MNLEDFQKAGKVYCQLVYAFRTGRDNSFSKEALTEMYERLVAQGQKVYGLRYNVPVDIQSWAKKNLVRTSTGTESVPAKTPAPVPVQAKTEPVPAKTPVPAPVQAKTPAPTPVGMSSAMAWAQQHQNKPASSSDRIQSLASQKLINVKLIHPGQEQKQEQNIVQPAMQQTIPPYKSAMEKLLEKIKNNDTWRKNIYSETGTREGYIKAIENQIRLQKQNGPCSRKSTPIWTPEMDRLLITGLHDRLADAGIGYQHMSDHARKLGYLFKYGHVLSLRNK